MIYSIHLPLISIAAATLPLFLQAGRNFEYEYTILVNLGLIIGLGIGGLCLHPDRLQVRNAKQISAFLLWITGAPLLLALPGLVAFNSGLCKCSANGFGLWFLINILPTWFVMNGILLWIGIARFRGIGRRSVALQLGFFLAVLALWTAAILWFEPQKRHYSFLLGFLHGPIYDDLIELDEGIALMALCKALIGLFLVAIAPPSRIFFRVFWGAAFLAAASWAFITASRMASTTVGMGELQALFNKKLDGEGFTLHYVQKSGDAQAGEYAQKVYQDTVFHMDELTEILADRSFERVQIFLYPSDRAKKLWFGAGSTDVTDVVTPSVHISPDSWPHPTLRHELVHALMTKYSPYRIGFHPNMLLTEGIAEALAPRERPVSIHTAAASLLAQGKVKDVGRLFSPLFWLESGDRSYTLAGSLLEYLLANHSMEPIKKLYGGASFDEAFNKSKEALIAEWKAQILKGYDPKRDELLTRGLFRYPGIVHDLCPHSKADLRIPRDSDPAVRLRQPIDWDPERDYLPWRMRLDPKDKGVKISAWRRQAIRLLSERRVNLDELSRLALDIKGKSDADASDLWDVHAAVMISDLLLITGNRAESDAVLAKLKERTKGKVLPINLELDIEARSMLSASGIGDLGEVEWRKYLGFNRKRAPSAFVSGENPLLTHARLRRGERSFLKADPDRQALLNLSVSSSGFHSPALQAEFFNQLAFSLMELGYYGDAAKGFKRGISEGSGSEKSQRLLERWAKRMNERSSAIH